MRKAVVMILLLGLIGWNCWLTYEVTKKPPMIPDFSEVEEQIMVEEYIPPIQV